MTTYSGEWIKDTKIRHGQGTLISKDGSIYEGNFYFNEPHGRGRKIYSTGNVYEGLWENGQP